MSSDMTFIEDTTEELANFVSEPVPLKDKWALWEQTASGTYKPRKVTSFATAQEFWAVWKGVPQPSELLDSRRLVRDNPEGLQESIDAIMIFRQGIDPEWEDPANATGGHFQLMHKPAAGGGQIDEYWNNLVLAVIGDCMDAGEIVTGIRLVDKLFGKNKVTDHIRLELWYHSSASPIQVAALKKSMESTLITRLDGSLGPKFKGDAILDKRHSTMK